MKDRFALHFVPEGYSVGGQKLMGRHAAGAALMREPDRALSLIEAVVAAVPDLPVTLKMRLGWDEDCLNAPDLARRARDAGVRMIAVHGRTRAQFYTGRADWAAIRPSSTGGTVSSNTSPGWGPPAKSSIRSPPRVQNLAGSRDFSK